MEHDSIGEISSGIKVLDRSVLILHAVADGPRSLAQLCDDTRLPRATTHRLATALEAHEFLSRTEDGRWRIGPGLVSLSAGHGDLLIEAATPLMHQIMEATGESVQLYRISGNTRLCVASVEPSSGLHNTVPVGSRLSLTAGSAARVFAAFGTDEIRARVLADAPFTAADLEQVRSDGWAVSFSEREPGLASVSVPVFNGNGAIVAALSISGLDARFPRDAGEKWGSLLTEAANQLVS
ncbi:HTH-type transcriptional repressor AllR [Corynebacterium kalinowskii]|uniref:HTH-type transcriptional repressor AllR n=1 Tax=Corynebacterium kalinowskii TaxID=2675216 RepID=A0A6B8VFT8_9CORY|nr:IclR family transcriptional regulator [Corynebacterium kalinowskii]QGU01859.1 HTH-type transcriptional repressor AllR [Corynebacterium kalinowskii]